MSTTTRPIDPRTRARRSARGLLAIPAAAAVTLAIWAVSQGLTTLHVRLGAGAHPSVTHVGAATVLAVTVIAGLLAWLTRGLADRLLPGGRRSWIRLALLLLAVSLLGPITAGTTLATKLALCAMHLAAGAVLIATLAGPRASRHTEAMAR